MATLPLYNAYDEGFAFPPDLDLDLDNNSGCSVASLLFDDAGNGWMDDTLCDLRSHGLPWANSQLSMEGGHDESPLDTFHQETPSIYDFDSFTFNQLSHKTTLPTPGERSIDGTIETLGEDFFSLHNQKLSEDIGKEPSFNYFAFSTVSSPSSSSPSQPGNVITPKPKNESYPPTPHTTPQPSPEQIVSRPQPPTLIPTATMVRSRGASSAAKRPPAPTRTSQRAHYHIEKRYRASLNDKFDALRLCLLSARAYLAVDYKPGSSEEGSPLRENSTGANGSNEKDGGAPDTNEGGTTVQKTNKSGVLSEAVEYIQHLERQNDNCRDRVEELEAHIRSIREALGKDVTFAFDPLPSKEDDQMRG